MIEAVNISDRAALVVITGDPGEGKTTAVTALARELCAAGHTVGGVIQRALEGETRRIGYELEDIATGERRPFASRRTSGPGFAFDESAWPWAADRLESAKLGCDVVVVDELGLLEGEGGGHLRALRTMSATPGAAKVLLATVRHECREPILTALGTPTIEIRAPLRKAELGSTLERVLSLLTK